MCWGENRDDFQRETGRVLCLILQFFLPTQAPCSLSDTYSSLLETHFLHRVLLPFMFSRAALAAGGTGEEETTTRS